MLRRTAVGDRRYNADLSRPFRACRVEWVGWLTQANGHRGPTKQTLPGLGPARAARDLLKAFERIGILANEEHQCGGLGIGFGAALFPLF